MKFLFLFLAALSLFAQNTTYPIVDNEARTVQLYNYENDTWMTYPIPDEIEGELDAWYWGDEQYLFYTGEYDAPTGIWEIRDGAFISIPPACGRIPNFPGEGEWKLIQATPDAPVYLCFTENDQRIRMPSLPDDIEYWVDDYGSTSSISPDHEWVTFLASKRWDETQPYEKHFFVYAYHIPTRQLNLLGKIGDDTWWELAGFGRWVSNTKGSLTTGVYQSWAPTTVYAFDVIRPDSLEFVLDGWIYTYPNSSFNFLDAPYYEYLETGALVQYESGSIADQVPCHFTRYDADGIRRLRLGYDCLGLQLRRLNDETYLTTVAHSAKAKSSTIIRFNPHTMEVNEIITGEIEGFYISYSNPNCLSVIFGKNGKIDLVDYRWDYQTFEMTMVSPRLPDIGKTQIRDVNLTTGEFGCDHPKQRNKG